MENLLKIVAVWFVVSIPVSLLIGRFLKNSNRIEDATTSPRPIRNSIIHRWFRARDAEEFAEKFDESSVELASKK